MAISSTALIMIAVLLIVAVGVAPSWPHSRSWGYAPAGSLGTVLIIVLIFALLGYF